MNRKTAVTIKTLSKKIHDFPDQSFVGKKALDETFLDWERIESLLNDPFRISAETVELINKERLKIVIQTDHNAWMHSPKLLSNFIFNKINKEDHSLILLGSSRINSEINTICATIEQTIPRSAVDVHVYCGLKGSSSFKAHYDAADNLILQQSGKCYWKVYKQKSKDCDYEFNVEGELLDVEFETELNPGDLIYVPMHQYHECFPLETRISLSIPIITHLNKMDRTWYKIERQ